MPSEPEFVYYEVNRGSFQIMDEGAVLDFPSLQALKTYFDDPTICFVLVTPENWQRLYDDGVFFS